MKRLPIVLMLALASVGRSQAATGWEYATLTIEYTERDDKAVGDNTTLRWSDKLQKITYENKKGDGEKYVSNIPMEEFFSKFIGKSLSYSDVVSWLSNDFTKMLNEFGRIGWELVTIDKSTKQYNFSGAKSIVNSTTYYFKRQTGR